MNKHAFLSASGAPAWSRCEAKVWREKDLPEETSVFAAEGTQAHELLERLLPGVPLADKKDFPPEMYDHVQKTLDYITAQEFDQIYAEQRLDISFITGEEDAQGTADVVGIKGNTITIVDLKYGIGVKVEAEGNEQLVIYGAAALKEFDLVGDITTIKLVISQPRLNHLSEWILTIDQLSEMIETLTTKAKRILTAEGGDLLSATPGKKQCQFCKVKGSCSEYRNLTGMMVANSPKLFERNDFLEKIREEEELLPIRDDTRLANCMDAVELIESWCVGVRREVEKRLQEDNFSDHRWKLVQGHKGHRKIHSVADLVDIAKEHGIDESSLYDKKPITITELERTHKKANPVFWAKVETLMTRPEGKPVVVPGGDKRPALNLALDFKAIEDDNDFTESLIGLTHERAP